MNISTKMYSDGFYKLSTRINGNIISVTYSDRTPFNDAIRDFKDHVSEYSRTHQRGTMPSDAIAADK